MRSPLSRGLGCARGEVSDQVRFETQGLVKSGSQEGLEITTRRGGIAEETVHYLVGLGGNVGDDVFCEKAVTAARLIVYPELVLSRLVAEPIPELGPLRYPGAGPLCWLLV